MSANSKIEWCDHTFNPWIGCTKVSPGCAHCYAEQRDKRHLIEKVDHWGKGAPRLRTSAANWKQPLKWNRELICEHCGEFASRVLFEEGATCPFCPNFNLHRPRVFCASLADWLDDEVPIAWVADLLALIHATSNLDWLLLTKRPENWSGRVRDAADHCHDLRRTRHPEYADVLGSLSVWLSHDLAPHNVWVGTSVEDQKRADERIPQLLQIPARIRFLSCEPLLGSINFKHHALHADGVHWVIVGGESGPGARECNARWPMQIVAQCKARGVPVFVKQLGANIVDRNDAGFEGESDREWPMDTHTRDIDSGYQGAPVRVLLRSSKGGDPAEWPEQLRVREFPLSLPSLASASL